MQRELPQVGKEERASFLPTLRTIDEKARTIDFVASTPTADRYGDSIKVEGWKLDSYRKNPVFLFGHRSQDPPIGKCVKVWTEQNPPALCQTIQFADAATYPFADTIFRLYVGGYLRAVSVGFMPLEQPVPMKDADGYTTGYEFNGQELLELSAVPVPANPEALARAVEKGFSGSDLALVFSGKEDSVASLRLEVAALKLELAALKTPRQESAELCSFDEVLDAIKEAGAASMQSVEKSPASDEIEITTLEQLGEGEQEITTIAELGEALR